MKIRSCTVIALFAAIASGTSTAQAGTYPVSGSFTYENASEKGPAKSCGKRNMRFEGNLRYDTGSGVPEYKNISVRASGPGVSAVIDEFFTGMIRGRVHYSLRIVDPDHIELRLDKTGGTTLLRRCG